MQTRTLRKSEIEEFFNDDAIEEGSDGPIPPADDDDSPEHEPAYLMHNVKFGSYFYRGYVWSDRGSHVQATNQTDAKRKMKPLRESDVAYLLSLEFTIPAQDHSKRRVVKRFQIKTLAEIDLAKRSKARRAQAEAGSDVDDEPAPRASKPGPKPGPKAKGKGAKPENLMPTTGDELVAKSKD